MLSRVIKTCVTEKSFAFGRIVKSPYILVFDPEEQFEAFGHMNFLFYGESKKKLRDYPYWRFDDISEMIDAIHQLPKHEDKVVVIDEMMIAEGLDYTALKQISVARRHWGCDIIACSQRPVSFPTTYFALADQVHISRIDDHRDLKHLAETGLFSTDELEEIRRMKHPSDLTDGEENFLVKRK